MSRETDHLFLHEAAARRRGCGSVFKASRGQPHSVSVKYQPLLFLGRIFSRSWNLALNTCVSSQPSSQTYIQETFINATSAATASQDGNKFISVLEKEKEGWRGCSAEPKRSTVIHRVPVHAQTLYCCY
ncbi:hypothetical protein MHYP_G00069880 [Metynnis hypsauchen]